MNLLGGVGMFLLGMHLMTDGLKMAAGKALRHILEHSTNTPMRAVFSGILITSLVQSSSAVTVATIGFVNAGLLKLGQAVRVIYGSNVGTTMTGWLVALLGFHVNIQAMALPVIGIGMFIKLFVKDERQAAYGMAMTGFGVLFLGIAFLKAAFTGIENVIDLQALSGTGFSNAVLFLGTGFLMTVLMQSSSAAMAITLTAAGSGIIPLEAAAAMVIGSNLGTTSTAVLAAIGATPNAKRVAVSHVLFNVITGIVALLTLPIWLWLVSGASQWLEGSNHIPSLLALFHTVFNVLGVLLMWFVTDRLVKRLESWFREVEDDESNPRHLDLTLVDTPELAHTALAKELQRVSEFVGAMAADAISTEASLSGRLKHDLKVVRKLVDAIGAFIVRLRQVALPEYLSPSISHGLSSVRYFLEVAELANQIDKAQSVEFPNFSEETQQAMMEYRKHAVSVFSLAREAAPIWDEEKRKAFEASLDKEYEQLKLFLMHRGAAGHMPVRHVVTLIEISKSTGLVAKQMLKGVVALDDFNSLAAIKGEEENAESEMKEEETIKNEIEKAEA